MTNYYLSIHKPISSNDSYAWLQTFNSREIQLDNEQDFLQVEQLCEDDKNMLGARQWSFLPIRTDHLTDLLFPALIHGTLNRREYSTLPSEENLFVVAALVYLIWDIVTLPIRLVTYLPRLCYNKCVEKTEHPLLPYLREKGLIERVDEETRVVDPQAGIRISEDEGQRVNIRLYKRKMDEEGQTTEYEIKVYRLSLSDREVPFVWSRRRYTVDAAYAALEGLATDVRAIPENPAIRS